MNNNNKPLHKNMNMLFRKINKYVQQKNKLILNESYIAISKNHASYKYMTFNDNKKMT